jgi:hypothetical protein
MTLEAVLVMVGVIATVISVAALAARLPAAKRPPAPRAPRSPSASVPSQLLRIERIVERSGESGLAAHALLRPVLSEIAEVRLARRGVQLNRDHDEARRLLGREAWELVRPDRPQPPHDRAPGLARRELEAVLDSLEAL